MYARIAKFQGDPDRIDESDRRGQKAGRSSTGTHRPRDLRAAWSYGCSSTARTRQAWA